MNAGLQCLCHIEPLAAYFLTGKYRGEGKGGDIAEAFASFVRSLWQCRQRSYNPQELHTALKSQAPHLFEGYEQQDVQEFFAFLLDALHEELNLVATPPPPATEEEEKADARLAEGRGEEFAAALAWLRYLQRGKSFLVDLLQGQVRDVLCCQVCGHQRRRFEAFLYLSVPVSRQMSSVADAVKKYLEEEVLTGDERWLCPHCKCKVDTKKSISLWKLPPVLVLHLKRFEFDMRSYQFRKISSALAAPLAIDFSPFVSSPQREAALYDVVAVANHHGAFGSGHYTAYCRVGAGTGEAANWQHFDDERVSPVAAANVISKDAYVLFLMRRGEEGSQIQRQTSTKPELWPHLVSKKNSVFWSLIGGPARGRSKSSLDLPSRTDSCEDYSFMPSVSQASTYSKRTLRAGTLPEGDPPVLLPGQQPTVSNASQSLQRKMGGDDSWDCVVDGGVPSNNVAGKVTRVDGVMVESFIAVGFDRARVVEALKSSKNDPHRAASALAGAL